ncbi:hypothetical protein Ddye_014229 [Dipteronia dyeriana]|uniref:SKP1-like protein n=1 Tax=Dipteronia dyeriana TaxID=168575 RepID=A0AAE0CKZ0_9ROSI|nr:hypothetical protein Ddye_014229 [Dipteronia dyeriana]
MSTSSSQKREQSQFQNQLDLFKVTRIITLESSDGPRFDVPEPIAIQMGTVRSFLEENESSGDTDVAARITVPLLNVSSSCLVQIIEYCTNHHQFKVKSAPENEVKDYDSGLLKEWSDHMIGEVLLSANYLDMKDLIELTMKGLAERIQNKSPEFISKLFGIENDFTPEEEAKIRQENSFAFEDIDQD